MNSNVNVFTYSLRKSARAALLALGISLLFYIFAAPNLKSDEHLEYLGISVFYGAVIFVWIWLIYAGFYAVSLRRRIEFGSKQRFGWKVHLPLGILGAFGGLLTAKWILSVTFGYSFSTGDIGQSLLVGLFITLMFLFYYAYRSSSQENLELKAAKAEAELHVFKNQMQPHFLFNSLNSLAELIDSNQAHASTMTQHLSDLYREILENSKQSVSSLESEFSIIRKYLALEKLRFGNRLEFELHEPEQSQNIFIPSLVLQTLTENAVKHGIAPSLEKGHIAITVKKENSGFKAEIHNTGRPFTNQINPKGTGIENTRSRLQLLYKDQHNFKIDPKSDGTIVSFWFSGDRNVR